MRIKLPEIIDRLTILRLKIERVGEEHLFKEYEEFKSALREFEEEGIEIKEEWFERLYEINGKIWDLEFEVRKIVSSDNVWKEAEEKIGFEELGRRALKVADLVVERANLKNEIAEATGSGFKEIKKDY